MPEIIIIICLGGALFLLLRHYPDSNNLSLFGLGKFKNLLGKLPKFKKKDSQDLIIEAITSNQKDVIAPIEIETAKTNYKEKDAELATSLYKAEEAFTASDLRLAEELCLEVISKNKRSSKAYTILGKIASSRGQFTDCKEALKVAIKCDSEMAEAYFELGKATYREENLTEAMGYFQKAITLEKGHAEWYGELGKLYMELRQYSKAAKMLKKASSLDIDAKEYRDLASEAEDKQRAHSVYSRTK